MKEHSQFDVITKKEAELLCRFLKRESLRVHWHNENFPKELETVREHVRKQTLVR